jgi:2-polyprenyl-3-methyl-5-hydroxy-6-metoxy-1,4-benzoquinol methylase
LDDGLAHAMDAEQVRLEAVLGPSRQRRVLDCSCGAGTQAIPLAELGWQVTATDVTQASLDAARAMAVRRNVAVDWRHARSTEAGRWVLYPRAKFRAAAGGASTI